jgi:hypothetical protein
MLTRSTRLPGPTETSSKPNPGTSLRDYSQTDGLFKADSPRFGRRDEAKIANEEDAVWVDGFFLEALQFAGKKG